MIAELLAIEKAQVSDVAREYEPSLTSLEHSLAILLQLSARINEIPKTDWPLWKQVAFVSYLKAQRLSFASFRLAAESIVSIESRRCASVAHHETRAGRTPLAEFTRKPPPGSVEAVCTRVIDGDTIEVNYETKVRYIGIDTPETKHPRKPVQRMGKEASRANELLVLGKRVWLEYDVERTDKYGRLLAYVYVDGVMVNEHLVRAGYAHVSTYTPNVRYVDVFLQAQTAAREKRLGLWGNGASPASEPLLR